MSSVPKDKHQLLDAINTIFPKLMADYRTVPVELARLCTIEGNVKGTAISVSDTVAYLIGWGKLVLKWHRLTSQNQDVDLPETGFKWNQLGLLAQHFQHHYRDWSYVALLNELDATVNQLSELINSLSNDELYGADWYETYTLGRMIQFNTSSPMKNMRTKVRRFIREQC